MKAGLLTRESRVPAGGAAAAARQAQHTTGHIIDIDSSDVDVGRTAKTLLLLLLLLLPSSGTFQAFACIGTASAFFSAAPDK